MKDERLPSKISGSEEIKESPLELLARALDTRDPAAAEHASRKFARDQMRRVESLYDPRREETVFTRCEGIVDSDR